MTNRRAPPTDVIARFEAACRNHGVRMYAEAEAAYRAVLARAPDFPPALGNLAELLRTTGRNADALDLFHRALDLDPRNALVRNNLGAALLDAGDPPAAIAELRRALKDDPAQHRARTNLGAALLRLGRLDDARSELEAATKAMPSSYPAHATLGAVLLRLGRPDDAIAALERAIAIEPRAPEAHGTLAGVLSAEGRIDESLSHYGVALRLQPDLFDAWSPMLFTLHHVAGLPPQALFDEHRRFGAAFERRFAGEALAVPVDRAQHGRLRIGFVSPDLRRHPVGFFLGPVLEAHDRTRFELVAYSDARTSDDVQVRLRAAVDQWRDTADWRDDAFASRVREDGIDILVDLAGHTTGNRLGVFARRAAPVQLTWLGYPDTTGLRAMDFRITDDVADPPGASDTLHTERLLRLRACFVAYERPAGVQSSETPPSAARGSVTFGSFNDIRKLSPRTAATWGAILRAVPSSTLALKARAFAIARNRERVLGWFANEGVSRERIVFQEFAARWEDSLRDYARLDIALDPFPYNGTTTTCDALCMGVPVVALRGDIHCARVSASILASLGQQALVAESEAAYIDLAVRLARDTPRLAELRRTLLDAWPRSPVGNPGRLARDLENAYLRAWDPTG